MAPTLTSFVATRPRYELTQERALAWLASAHAESEARIDQLDDAARLKFEVKVARAIRRVACTPDKIARRGHSIADFDAFRFEDTAIYDLRRTPRGKGTAARTRLFGELVDAYFTQAYAAETAPPDDLVHVTCTGYASPSGAQKLVAHARLGRARA